MKTNLLKALGCILVTGTLSSAQAQGMYDEIREGTFFQASIGGDIMRDFKLSSFTFGLDNAKSTADAGYSFDIMGGYQFNQYLAAGLNTGVLYNRIDTVGGLPVSPDRLDMWQTPLMADLIFTVPLRGPLSAYIGAGGGGVFTSIDLRVGGFGSVRDTDTTYGYQAFAGLKYAIMDQMDIGVGYKFMGTGRYSWNDRGADLSSNQLYTHSILATFTFRF